MIRLLLILLGLSSFAFAQEAASRLKFTPKPSLQPVDQELYIPYWTLEPGWHTGIELRNNLARELVVTPAIRTREGIEIPLAAVKLQPNELVELDLHLALAAAAPALPDKTGAYGSAVFRFQGSNPKNLYAGSMIHLEGRPIAYHFDAVQKAPRFSPGTTREGIWWLPNEDTQGFLTITNASGNQANVAVTFSDEAGKTKQIQISLGPRSVKRLDMKETMSLAELKGTLGGVRIEMSAETESVYADHVVFNETTGFSAILRMFERNPTKSEQRQTLRAPMMALSNPDPVLMMPEGTKLRPKLFLRNATGKKLEVDAALRWRTEGGNGFFDLGEPLTQS